MLKILETSLNGYLERKTNFPNSNLYPESNSSDVPEQKKKQSKWKNILIELLTAVFKYYKVKEN